MIHVLLKKDGALIEGRVSGGDKPVSKAFVVLAPDDRKKEHLFRTATTTSNGSFRITSVAPGPYTAYALDRNEEDAFYDDEYLRKFAKNSVAVNVDPSSSKTIVVPLVDRLANVK